MKFTRYFEVTRERPDRVSIRIEWIARTIETPLKETIQKDGRIRRWARIDEAEGRYLRVVLLEDA